jgi:hypothetical protein
MTAPTLGVATRAYASEHCPFPLPSGYDPAGPIALLFDEKNGLDHIVKHREPATAQFYDDGRHAGIRRFELIDLSRLNVESGDHDLFWQLQFAGAGIPRLNFRRSNDDNLSAIRLDDFDVVVTRSTVANEARMREYIRGSSFHISQFHTNGKCEIVRLEQDFEVKKAFVFIGLNNDRLEDLRCYFSGLLVFYGLGNYPMIQEKMRAIDVRGKTVLNFNFGGIRALYAPGMKIGATRSAVDAYLKQYFCDCGRYYPETFRPDEAEIGRACAAAR